MVAAISDQHESEWAAVGEVAGSNASIHSRPIACQDGVGGIAVFPALADSSGAALSASVALRSAPPLTEIPGHERSLTTLSTSWG